MVKVSIKSAPLKDTAKRMAEVKKQMKALATKKKK
jgi:hypothetical protein